MFGRTVRLSRLRALANAARIEMLEPRQMLAAPDLTAAIVSLDTTIARGHQLTVDFRITNSGDAPTAQGWTDRIWLSPTNTFDSKTAVDIGIWGNGDVPTLPLAPGGSYEVSRTPSTPPTLATGTWYVFVEADRWGEIAESNEANNLSAASQITVVAPDIAMSKATITNPSSPYDVTWGQQIDVSFTVTNKTAARLDGYWYDAVVASKDATLDSSDWALNYVVYEPLAPHASYTHTTQVRVDGPWALPAGAGYLLFVANNVEWSSPDADRSDNVIAIPITVHAPDLQVTASSLDDKGTPITPASLVPTGTSVNVAWTATNTGDASAVAGWSDSVYISKKNVYDNAAQWLGYFDPPPGTFPLAAGGHYTNSFSLDTTTYDGGQYYIFVRADSNNGLTQSNSDNDVSPPMPLQLVAPGASPDLTIDNLSITPNIGDIGTNTLTISYNIHNIDPANPTTADYWFDTLWLSRTPTFDRATAVWANTLFDNPPVIAPGGVYTNTATIPFPTNVGLGQFYAFVETDVFNWQQEKSGNNNLTTRNDLTLNLHGADFTTSTLTIDNGSGDINNHDITVGSPFTVNWHVDNKGDINTPADWIDAVYVSDLWYLDQTAVKIGEFSAQTLGLTTPIAPGDGYNGTGIVTIPAWLGTGNKNIFVVSGLQSTGGGDGYSIQYQPDSNIYNNTYGAVQVQLRQADLAVTGATVNVPSASVGDTIHVNWTVTNNGDAPVAPGWVDRVYLSRFSTFSEQTARSLFEFTTSFSMGGQGSSYATGMDIDTSSLEGGKYYIFVVTDANHTLAETNESNNVGAALPLTLVSVPGLPDLTASIDSVLPDPATGDIGMSSVDVTYTVTNAALHPTDGGAWSDAVWLSPTPTFNPATAISLGSFGNNAPTLSPGGHYTSTATVNLPAGFGIGTFYLFVEADVDNNQLESDGTNNLSPAAGALPVELNGPDLAVSNNSFNNYTNDPNNHQVTLNSPFELGWTIENQGNVNSSSNWLDAIFVSDSPVWDPSSARLVTQFSAPDPLPLASLALYDALNQISLPGWVGPGLHFLFIVTGLEHQAEPSAKPLFGEAGLGSLKFEPDADFASNVSAPIRVNVLTPNVDLTVTIDTAPVAVTPGQFVTAPFEWTVTNNGSDTANGNTNTGQNWTDTLYLTQTPDDPASYIYLTSYDTASVGNTPLWGGSSYLASFDGFDIPSYITPGNWFFVIVTDSNNDQGETSDANNTATIPVQINLIDLTVPSVTVAPAAGTVGQTSMQVTWTVHNGGDADSTSGWSDGIYVSASPVFDASAMQITSIYHYDVLAQGADYIASAEIILPGGLGAGTLYVYVVADSNNYVPETNEDNNASAGFPITASGPDLQVTASQITATNPVLPVVNGTVSISWTVKNAGNTPTTATYWYDSVYISDNPVYGQGNRWPVYPKFISAGELDTGTLPLAPGASYTAHLNNIIIPGAAGPGARYLFVVSDTYTYYYNLQAETNEDNNAGLPMPITLGAPDLVVSAASSDSMNATVGDSLVVHWTVTNDDKNGTSPAQGPWYDRIYLSNDAVYSYDDTAIFGLQTPFMSPVPTPLDAGKSYTNTASITIPSNAGAGAKYLIFVTDADDNQGEDDNTNNARAIPITLDAPDLVVSSFTGPATAVVNGQVALTWTIQNIGAYTAHGPWYDAVYLSDDAVFDQYSDTYLGAAYTGSLPAGVMPLQPAGSVSGGNPTDRYTMTRSFDVPYYLPLGAKYLFIRADYYGAQTETDETNNLRMLPITIVAPDLTVVSPSGPISATPGDSVAFTWTTRNVGTVPAYGPWYDAVYISDDDSFGNADDRFLGYYYAVTPPLPLQPAGSVSGGNPTDRYTVTRNFTIPADMSGIKHIFIKADGGYYYWFGSVYGDNIQGEADETNNVAAFTIDLGGGSPPVITGTDAADSLYLRRTGDGLLIQAFFNTPTTGAPTWVYGLGASIAFNGLGGSDTLTLDFSNGNPIPSLGIAYDGGAGTDSLLVTNPTAATALTVNGGSLSVAGNAVTHTSAEQVALDGLAGSLIQLGSLNMYDNLAVVAGKSLTLRLSTLSISAAVALDLADNDLILDYAGAAPLATVRQWLRNGQMGTQPSIRTSTPSPSPTHPTALALADNSLLQLTTWAGHLLTASSNFSQLLIKQTYSGDTNMDGRVTSADYLNVLANMGHSNAQWFMGDLNHDGVVTPDDLALVSQNMGAGTSGASGPPLAAAAVTAAAPKTATKTATRKSGKSAKSIKYGLASLALKLKHMAKLPIHRS